MTESKAALTEEDGSGMEAKKNHIVAPQPSSRLDSGNMIDPYGSWAMGNERLKGG